MIWVKEIINVNGIKTICLPQPKDKNKLPQCSYCGSRLQFLHFWPGILKFLKEDDLVPKFCDANCMMMFIENHFNNKNETKKIQTF